MDYWFYFLHKSIELIKSEGVVSFVTSRYWVNSKGAKKLIKHISDTSKFINIVDIGDLIVFDNVVGHHMISILQKSKKEKNCLYLKLSENVNKIVNSDFDEIRKISSSEIISKDYEILLEKRISLNTTTTLDDFYNVSQGIVEASDKISKKMYKNNPDPKHFVGEGIFVLSKEETEHLNLSTEEKSILEIYEDSGCINRYFIDYSKTRNLIYSDKVNREKIKNEKNFSVLRKHLDSMQGYITSSFKPYGLHRSRNYEDFVQPKLIGPSMFEVPCFSFDNRKLFVGMSYNIITSKGNSDLFYILGLLNSSFGKKWFYDNAKHRGVGVDVGVEKLRQFPIPNSSQTQQQDIISCVNSILKARANLKYDEVNKIETELDSKVYSLYGLISK